MSIAHGIKRLLCAFRARQRLLGLALIVGWVLLLAPAVQAGYLNLAWDAPTTSVDDTALTDLSLYRVYYGTASSPCPGGTYQEKPSPTSSPSSGDVITFQLTGLTDGTTYFVQATAVDTSGLQSTCSNEVSGAASSGGGDSGGGGGGRCLIATAAYGSALEPQVVFLRAFRDQYLTRTRAGKAFVGWYDRASPPVAARIRQSPPLRGLVRGVLWPVVGIVWLIFHPGIGVGILVGGGGIVGWLWSLRKLLRRAQS